MVTVSSKNTNAQYLKGNDRPWVEYAECDKTEECPLYKGEGKCACSRNIIGRNTTCPNGKWHRLTGPTKRAKSFYDWGDMVSEKYAPTATEYRVKICVVADYVFLPMYYLSGAGNDLDGVINGHFVPIENFDADMIEKIVRFVPRTWFENAPIRQYTNEEVPKFVQQLKEEMPLLWSNWANKFPESADKYSNFSHVGRYVYIESLPDRCEIPSKNGTYIKSGRYMECERCQSVFIDTFGSKNAKVSTLITIDGDMVVKVTEDMNLGDHPRFKD